MFNHRLAVYHPDCQQDELDAGISLTGTMLGAKVAHSR